MIPGIYITFAKKNPIKNRNKNKPGETDIKINTATVANAW